MTPLVLVPVKRFFVAKGRLAPLLDAPARSRLGRALAERTLATIAAAGIEPTVMAADETVAEWARSHGRPSHLDPAGTDLDASARVAISMGTRPWLIVHADLPLLSTDDIEAAAAVLSDGDDPLSPSNDGGTSLIGGRGDFGFAYGTGSFHRHLARLSRPRILVRVGLSLDLDDPSDFAAAVAHPRGRWLREYADRS